MDENDDVQESQEDLLPAEPARKIPPLRPQPPKAKLTERQVKKVRELRKAGLSQEAIAAALRMTRNTLVYRMKQSGVEFAPATQGKVRKVS